MSLSTNVPALYQERWVANSVKVSSSQAGHTPVFQVPDGRKFILTAIQMRNPSTTLLAYTFNLGSVVLGTTAFLNTSTRCATMTVVGKSFQQLGFVSGPNHRVMGFNPNYASSEFYGLNNSWYGTGDILEVGRVANSAAAGFLYFDVRGIIL